jgi:hypothetical protein
MPTKKKQFRKVLPPFHRPVHFTVDEARRAVRVVMERHGIDPREMERLAEASAWEDEAEHCAHEAAG